MKTLLVLLIFPLAVAASVISCRNAGDEGGPTPAEAAYLDSVERAWSLFGSRLDEFSTLFG
jgi:hypothetical protein